MSAAKVLRKAVDNQVNGLGFSLVEDPLALPHHLEDGPGGGAALRPRRNGRHLRHRQLPRPHRQPPLPVRRKPRPRPPRTYRPFSASKRSAPPARRRRSRTPRLPHQSRGLRWPGSAHAGRSSRRSRPRSRLRSLLASILWSRDALRHLQLPRAPLQPPHRFAAGDSPERAARPERALPPQIPPHRGTRRFSPLQRRKLSPPAAAVPTSASSPSPSPKSQTKWAPAK